MTTQRRSILVVCIALLVVGAAIYRFDGLSVTRTADADDPGGFEGRTRPAPSVQVMKPYRADIQRMSRLVAHIEPYRQSVVYSMVTGIVKPDPIEEGTRVDPGAVLCELDSPHLVADIATAKSELARATARKAEANAQAAQAAQGVVEADARVQQSTGAIAAAKADRRRAAAEVEYRSVIYRRLQKVREASPQVVSQDEVDEAGGKFQIAEAELEVSAVGIDSAKQQVVVAKAMKAAAEANAASARAAGDAAAAHEAVAQARLAEADVTLGFATISAPIKGVVSKRMIDTGSLVKDGARNSGATALFHIIDDDKLRIWFALAVPDAPYCRPGNKVVVVVDDIADPATGEKPLEIRATVTRVTEALESATRTMKAEVELDNPKGKDGHKLLRAGMFARARVSLEVHKGVLLLPTRAVQTRKHKSSVLIVRADGTVNKVSVKIGVDDGLVIEVRDGVTESDQVVIKGMGLVADGEKATAVIVSPDTK